MNLLPRLRSDDVQHHEDFVTGTLLLTPGLVSWVGDGHPFLGRAINHVWRDVSGPEVMLTSAVVDALPDPRETTTAAKGRRGLQGLESLPYSPRGHEGLCLQLCGAQRHRVDYKRSRQDLRTELGQDLGTIRFTARPGRKIGHRRAVSRSIVLATANTLFLNGNPYTVLHDIWVRGGAGSHGRGEFGRKSRWALETFDVFMDRGSLGRSGLYLPLEQLTAVRCIRSSMGNIIREIQASAFEELSSSVPPQAPFPASRELESIVPQILARRKSTKADTPLQIYALVVPAQLGASYLSTSVKFPGLQNALWDGASLHRVTSGGGGWGKKQGLLSLDPAISFDQTSMNSNLALPSYPNQEQSSRRENFLAPGNFILFYGTKEDGRPTEALPPSGSADENQGSEVALGVIPEPQQMLDPIEAKSRQSSKIYAVANFFGMFSERGSCIESWEGRIDVPEIQEDLTKGTVQSRIDVPYMRFSSLSNSDENQHPGPHH